VWILGCVLKDIDEMMKENGECDGEWICMSEGCECNEYWSCFVGKGNSRKAIRDANEFVIERRFEDKNCEKGNRSEILSDRKRDCWKGIIWSRRRGRRMNEDVDMFESDEVILEKVFVKRDGIGDCSEIEKTCDDFGGEYSLLLMNVERVFGVVDECEIESIFEFSGYVRDVLSGEEGRGNKTREYFRPIPSHLLRFKESLWIIDIEIVGEPKEERMFNFGSGSLHFIGCTFGNYIEEAEFEYIGMEGSGMIACEECHFRNMRNDGNTTVIDASGDETKVVELVELIFSNCSYTWNGVGKIQGEGRVMISHCTFLRCFTNRDECCFRMNNIRNGVICNCVFGQCE
jgi:hypothetical protein